MNYQYELEKLKKNLEYHADDVEKQLEIFEHFCEKLEIKPEGPFPKTQQELIEMQQRGVAPDLENVLEVYLGINGILEENGLSKNIDRTNDQRVREQAGFAPNSEPHLNKAETQSPDPDWPPKPSSAKWPPKP